MSRLIKEKIREKVSQAVDVLIPEKRWEQYIELLDRDGIPNRKQLISIFMLLCQQVEVIENIVEDFQFRLELLEGRKPVVQTSQEFKLRTSLDVMKDLQQSLTPDTKAFYVSPSDWKVLEKNIDPELAKTKPEHGYGKEKNPLSGNEETCLYYREMPVFKA